MSASTFLRRAMVLGLIAATMPAMAATRVEIQGARSYMDSYGSHAAFVEAVFPARPLGDTRYHWSPDLSAGWIDARDVPRYRGSRYDTSASVTLLAAGARVHRGDAGDWYQPLFASFQVAATNHTTQALSGHYQFVSTLGWQASHFTVALRHISNGGLEGPNRGETMALIGVAFDI